MKVHNNSHMTSDPSIDLTQWDEEGWDKDASRNLKQQHETLRQQHGIKWLIYPDDWFYKYWTLVVTIIMLYTATVVPYRIALIDEEDLGWYVFDLLVDFLFFIDVIINCYLAFIASDNKLVTDRKIILTNYLKTWMILDILAWIPLHLVFEQTSKDFQSLIRVARFPRLYRLVKIAKLARIFQEMSKRRRSVVNVNANAKISLATERLIWFTVIFSLSIHIIACLWIFIGRIQWYEHDNWLLRYNYPLDQHHGELYATGMYWAITTITTVGYGDISAGNSTERVYSIIIMVLGVFIYSYTIGALSNLMSNLDARKAKLNQKLELLAELSIEYGISKEFHQKLATALEYDHHKNRQDFDEISECLPLNLRNQLRIVVYRNVLAHNSFFTDRAKEFVAFVIPHLKPQLSEEEEYVYKEGETCSEMYFILSGEVSRVLIKQTIVPYMTIAKDYHFGECSLLFSDKQTQFDTTRTMIRTDMLTLSREQFEAAIFEFQDIGEQIMSLAKERHKRNQAAKAQAIREVFQEIEVQRRASVSFTLQPIMKPEIMESNSSRVVLSTSSRGRLDSWEPDTIEEEDESWESSQQSRQNSESEPNSAIEEIDDSPSLFTSNAFDPHFPPQLRKNSSDSDPKPRGSPNELSLNNFIVDRRGDKKQTVAFSSRISNLMAAKSRKQSTASVESPGINLNFSQLQDISKRLALLEDSHENMVTDMQFVKSALLAICAKMELRVPSGDDANGDTGGSGSSSDNDENEEVNA